MVATLEGLRRLPKVFKKDGVIHAGAASGLADGAAALVVSSRAWAERSGRVPLARVVAWGHAGVDPKVMGIGPVPALRTALARAGATLDQLDLIEVNEAFAPQYLAVERELKLNRDQTNVNGGAIAVGHPLGMSGARLVVTLLHELRRREGRYGLATLCVGVGQGQAALFER